MITPRRPRPVSRQIGRRAIAAAAAATILGTTALPASAKPSPVPIVGDIVTCTINGSAVQLVGVSGHMLKEETTRIDRRGRARTVFTVRADHAELVGPDGTSYALTGRGFDRVLYPTADNTGKVLRERMRFHFDVVGPSGRVGVVRFSMRVGRDGPPVTTDRSTCQIPHN